MKYAFFVCTFLFASMTFLSAQEESKINGLFEFKIGGGVIGSDGTSVFSSGIKFPAGEVSYTLFAGPVGLGFGMEYGLIKPNEEKVNENINNKVGDVGKSIVYRKLRPSFAIKLPKVIGTKPIFRIGLAMSHYIVDEIEFENNDKLYFDRVIGTSVFADLAINIKLNYKTSLTITNRFDGEQVDGSAVEINNLHPENSHNLSQWTGYIGLAWKL